MVAALRLSAAPTLAFAVGAGAVWAISLALVAALPGFDSPGLVAAGIAFDLTVTVTLLAWLIPVRHGRWPAAVLVPIFALSAIGVSAIVPPEAGISVAALRAAAVTAELGLASWIALRIARLARRPVDRTLDRLERCRAVARELVGANAVAEIVAFELAVLAYAFGPTDRAALENGARPFATHRKSGYGPILGALGLVAIAEAIPLHLLLARWSPTAAWIVTALGLYALVYLIADARAAAARPVLVDAERLLVRTGIRWTAEIDRATIAAATRRAPRDGAKPLSLALIGSPNVWLELSTPVEARGVYGRRRRSRLIALAVDDPAQFLEQLARG